MDFALRHGGAGATCSERVTVVGTWSPHVVEENGIYPNHGCICGHNTSGILVNGT